LEAPQAGLHGHQRLLRLPQVGAQALHLPLEELDAFRLGAPVRLGVEPAPARARSVLAGDQRCTQAGERQAAGRERRHHDLPIDRSRAA
jgi:hypothetical protein